VARPKGWQAAALMALMALLVACSDGAEPVGANGSGSPARSPSIPGSGLVTPPAVPTAPLPTGGTPGRGDLGGNWSGTWADSAGSTGILEIDWRQDGLALMGAITIDGWSCLTGGVVSGSVSGNAVQFLLRQRDIQVTYEGTTAGRTLSGTYSTNCDDSAGTWRVAKSG
jgi:F0F1-type ATP synthase membrane subunit c/vacuolar-type H+-ATPase subunit K